MDILTLKSKVKLGCNMCDKCCIYRGDIKLTPINVCKISRFLELSNRDFIEKYTDKLEGRPLELVLKTVGEKRQCILYDEKIHGCSIHKIKPMQCTMFPLVPENLKRDYFYDSGQCRIENAKEITVNKWLNGNNRNYSKNKKSCLEWIHFLEFIQPKLLISSDVIKKDLFKKLYLEYDIRKRNYYSQMKQKINKIILDINKEKE